MRGNVITTIHAIIVVICTSTAIIRADGTTEGMSEPSLLPNNMLLMGKMKKKGMMGLGMLESPWGAWTQAKTSVIPKPKNPLTVAQPGLTPWSSWTQMKVNSISLPKNDNSVASPPLAPWSAWTKMKVDSIPVPGTKQVTRDVALSEKDQENSIGTNRATSNPSLIPFWANWMKYGQLPPKSSLSPQTPAQQIPSWGTYPGWTWYPMDTSSTARPITSTPTSEAENTSEDEEPEEISGKADVEEEIDLILQRLFESWVKNKNIIDSSHSYASIKSLKLEPDLNHFPPSTEHPTEQLSTSSTLNSADDPELLEIMKNMLAKKCQVPCSQENFDVMKRNISPGIETTTAPLIDDSQIDPKYWTIKKAQFISKLFSALAQVAANGSLEKAGSKKELSLRHVQGSAEPNSNEYDAYSNYNSENGHSGSNEEDDIIPEEPENPLHKLFKFGVQKQILSDPDQPVHSGLVPNVSKRDSSTKTAKISQLEKILSELKSILKHPKSSNHPSHHQRHYHKNDKNRRKKISNKGKKSKSHHSHRSDKRHQHSEVQTTTSESPVDFVQLAKALLV